MLLSSTDILKHTDKVSPDHVALEQALDKIKSVMTFINDDKRKTEAKLKLFEIHNDIEMCPVSHKHNGPLKPCVHITDFIFLFIYIYIFFQQFINIA